MDDLGVPPILGNLHITTKDIINGNSRILKWRYRTI